MLTELSRTFQELVFLQVEGSFHTWEIDVECHGVLDVGQPASYDTPATSDWPEVYGLEVKGARIEGEEVTAPHLLDWLDSLINHQYWYGELNDTLETKVLEALTCD